MEAAKQIKGTLRASPHSVRSAEQAYHSYCYDVPHGHSIEDVLRPEYWANEAKKFLNFDIIVLRAEDMSFWAKALVVGKSEKSIKLRMIDFQDLKEQVVEFTTEALSDYEITFRGLKGHSVVRKSDKGVIADGFDTKEAAEKALKEHLKAVGA